MLSINNASITVITKKMRFLYINEFILETSYSVCMERLIISLHENINNSKFFKKKIPRDMITASKRQWQGSPDSVPQTQTHVNNEVK